MSVKSSSQADMFQIQSNNGSDDEDEKDADANPFDQASGQPVEDIMGDLSAQRAADMTEEEKTK